MNSVICDRNSQGSSRDDMPVPEVQNEVFLEKGLSAV